MPSGVPWVRRRAKKPLYLFPPSAERDALLALPNYVLQRDR